MDKLFKLSGLLFILSLTTLIYWQGVSGIFLLDDYGVLPDLSNYNYLSTWNQFFLFLLEGDTGPTGRPISLATFFFNSQSWPASPYAFKVTNIIIHVINGALIFWFITILSKTINLSKKKSNLLVLFVTGFWLLHPLQITSVLYIVQRMTELSTLFMVVGLIVYLHGRIRLTKTPDLVSYSLLSIGIVLSGTLAVLSKETGALLVGYIFALEYFLLRPKNIPIPPKFNHWFSLFIILPLVLLMAYIISYGLDNNAYVYRNFTLEERILTQPRILFQYLSSIFAPGLQTPSLFHDDYVVSHTILTPWTTLPAILGIIILGFGSWFYRKKQPILGFAIAWFFIGHSLESTLVPLEFYFEHRNYLPILGPIIALVYFTIKAFQNYPQVRKSIVFSSFIFTLLLIASTLSNTIMWGKPIELIVGWSQEHPKSIRATETLEALELDMGFKIEDRQLKSSIENLYLEKNIPSSYTLLRELKYSCLEGNLTTKKLDDTSQRLHQSIFESSSANTLNSFALDWLANNCRQIPSDNMISFLNKLLTAKQLQHGFVPHIIHYNLSRIWEKEKNLDKTLTHLKKAYELNPELGGLLLQASHLSSAGYHDEALALLQDTSDLKTSFRKRLILALRQPEIDKLITRINNNKLTTN